MIALFTITEAQLQRLKSIEIRCGRRVDTLAVNTDFMSALLAIATEKDEGRAYAMLRAEAEGGETESILLAIARPPITLYDQVRMEWEKLDGVTKAKVKHTAGGIVGRLKDLLEAKVRAR